MLQKVEKNDIHQNGGCPVPVSVEFADAERDTSVVIYDDIPNGTPNGVKKMTTFAPEEEKITPEVTDDVYAVPDKRKKEGSPKIGTL